MKVLTWMLITLPLLSSCSSYVNNLHKQISYEEKMQRQKAIGVRRTQARNSPVTLNNSARSNIPNRQYEVKGKKRYKANDLVDNGPTGSLWTGDTEDNYLFVTNNIKKNGDFIIVEVKKDFKDKITQELERAFPEIKSSRRPKAAVASEEKKESEESSAGSKSEGNNKNKIYDKISTQVVERINRDYLLIRGRKEVIFRKAKRYVQVQGVVLSKDVKSNDTVFSDKLLEPRITVLRY